jgi:uncharacterized protein YbaR (Trm112 family)
VALRLRLSEGAQEALRCPVCRARLAAASDRLTCLSPSCGARFPVIDGVPVLLNEASSVFAIDDVISRRQSFFKPRRSGLKAALSRMTPSISNNLKARENYARFAGHLLDQSTTPRVLVLGGSIAGRGMKPFLENPAFDLVETDVQPGPRANMICDAHDIPFADQTFDGIIAQAVLEHVADPQRCAGEIHRVLKKQGLVYAETPFIQQVHGGRYDFTRFTLLGHRRLFREFDEIASGAVNGPGMALAWSYQYFLLSFATSRLMRYLLGNFARFTSFFLKYFDRHLIDKPGALDAASGFYFMGRKGERTLTDRELIRGYRGML